MDATAILDSLDADKIRERISEIERERESLIVLLRAANRRGKKKSQPQRNANQTAHAAG